MIMCGELDLCWKRATFKFHAENDSQPEFLMKDPRVRNFKLLGSPGIDSKELILNLCRPAGRYDNPIPTRFRAPCECLKFPAQASILQNRFLVRIVELIIRMGEGDPRTKSIQAALKLTFMGHGRLDFILDSYSIPGIDFSSHSPSKNTVPYQHWAGICSRVKEWKIDSWNRLGNKFGIEVPVSHVHVKINFSYGIDSWNRCLSVHKRLQIRAQDYRYIPTQPGLGMGTLRKAGSVSATRSLAM